MILFETRVAVPENIILQIGMELKKMVLKEIDKNTNLKMQDKMDLDRALDNCAMALAKSNSKSCEGWSLDKYQAERVANELRLGRKIMAIKEFRAATGAGLRDAKFFIDKFPMNEVGSIEFMATFV